MNGKEIVCEKTSRDVLRSSKKNVPLILLVALDKDL